MRERQPELPAMRTLVRILEFLGRTARSSSLPPRASGCPRLSCSCAMGPMTVPCIYITWTPARCEACGGTAEAREGELRVLHLPSRRGRRRSSSVRRDAWEAVGSRTGQCPCAAGNPRLPARRVFWSLEARDGVSLIRQRVEKRGGSLSPPRNPPSLRPKRQPTPPPSTPSKVGIY